VLIVIVASLIARGTLSSAPDGATLVALFIRKLWPHAYVDLAAERFGVFGDGIYIASSMAFVSLFDMRWRRRTVVKVSTCNLVRVITIQLCVEDVGVPHLIDD